MKQKSSFHLDANKKRETLIHCLRSCFCTILARKVRIATWGKVWHFTLPRLSIMRVVSLFNLGSDLICWNDTFAAAIDLVDEAAAKLKMEITSKPTALDEINRSVLKLEMERLSLTNDTDKASKERLNRLDTELSILKEKQAELTEQWEHEKSVMTRIQSIKEEVCDSALCENMRFCAFWKYAILCFVKNLRPAWLVILHGGNWNYL